MSKAILVIDMPSGCEECQLAVETTYNDMCCITGSRIISYGKFRWCPLKPLPKKMEGSDSIKYQWGEYEDGWNHCIDCLVDE